MTNADSQKISEEISAIASLSETSSVLVIIDDYTNYMEVLHKFSLLGGKKAQFLLTARSAINYNKMPIILEEFFVEEGATAILILTSSTKMTLETVLEYMMSLGFGVLMQA